MKVAGIVVLLIGLGLTLFTTVTYFTKEKVADIGRLEISKEKPHSFYWSPILGVVVMGIGGVMLWQGSKK